MPDVSPLAAAAGGTPLMVLLAVLALTLVLSFVPSAARLYPQFSGIRRLFATVERRLNRESRSEANRIIRGAVVALLAALAAAALGWGLWRLALTVPFGIGAEIVVLFFALSQSGVLAAMAEAAAALQDDDLAAARTALGTVGAGDRGAGDGFGLARLAIEEGARGFLERFLAPAFWYVLAGLPGVFVYGTSLALSGVLASRGTSAEGFGLAARRFSDALDYLPARLAGVILIVAGAFLPKASPAAGAAVLRRHGKRYPGPNGGWLLAPMAGVLGLALGGPGGADSAGGAAGGWIGDGRARANAVDVRRAIYLLAVGNLLVVVLAAVLLLVKLAP